MTGWYSYGLSNCYKQSNYDHTSSWLQTSPQRSFFWPFLKNWNFRSWPNRASARAPRTVLVRKFRTLSPSRPRHSISAAFSLKIEQHPCVHSACFSVVWGAFPEFSFEVSSSLRVPLAKIENGMCTAWALGLKQTPSLNEWTSVMNICSWLLGIASHHRQPRLRLLRHTIAPVDTGCCLVSTTAAWQRTSKVAIECRSTGGPPRTEPSKALKPVPGVSVRFLRYKTPQSIRPQMILRISQCRVPLDAPTNSVPR